LSQRGGTLHDTKRRVHLTLRRGKPRDGESAIAIVFNRETKRQVGATAAASDADFVGGAANGTDEGHRIGTQGSTALISAAIASRRGTSAAMVSNNCRASVAHWMARRPPAVEMNSCGISVP